MKNNTCTIDNLINELEKIKAKLSGDTAVCCQSTIENAIFEIIGTNILIFKDNTVAALLCDDKDKIPFNPPQEQKDEQIH